MAIMREVHRRTGTNAAAITGEADIPTEFPAWERFRATDQERSKYGAATCLEIWNDNANHDVQVRFYTGVETPTGMVRILKAGGNLIINPDDGINFYDFDVRNPQGAGNDVAIGEIRYNVRWVKQTAEQTMADVANVRRS